VIWSTPGAKTTFVTSEGSARPTSRPTRRSKPKNVYTVELDWSGPLPDGSCTCRHHADGNFCKHLVATGLAAIDTGWVAVDDTVSSEPEAALEAAVQAMDIDELRELVMTLAQRDDGVRRLLEIRATTASVATRTPKPSWRPMCETRWRSGALSTTDVPLRSQEWPVKCSTNSRTTSTVVPAELVRPAFAARNDPAAQDHRAG